MDRSVRRLHVRRHAPRERSREVTLADGRFDRADISASDVIDVTFDEWRSADLQLPAADRLLRHAGRGERGPRVRPRRSVHPVPRPLLRRRDHRGIRPRRRLRAVLHERPRRRAHGGVGADRRPLPAPRRLDVRGAAGRRRRPPGPAQRDRHRRGHRRRGGRPGRQPRLPPRPARRPGARPRARRGRVRARRAARPASSGCTTTSARMLGSPGLVPVLRAIGRTVGHGDCGFVRTGLRPDHAARLAATRSGRTCRQQAIGIDTGMRRPAELASARPGAVTDDVRRRLRAAVRVRGSIGHGRRVPCRGAPHGRAGGQRPPRSTAVLVDGDRGDGRRDRAGPFAAPVVVDVAGAWAAELAATVGRRGPGAAWRHDTAYFGLPDGRATDFPIVLDEINEVYFRPEGREQTAGRARGRQRARRLARTARWSRDADVVEEMIRRVCAARAVDGGRAPSGRAMAARTGSRPTSTRSSVAPGRTASTSLCGFSGTGFKTAPAIGAHVAELILDGRTTTADIAGSPSTGSRPAGRSSGSTRTACCGTDGPVEDRARGRDVPGWRRVRAGGRLRRRADPDPVHRGLLRGRPPGPLGQLISVALSGGTLLFVLHTAGAQKRIYRVAAVVLVIAAIVGTVVAVVFGDGTMGRSATSVVGLFLAVVAPLVILRRIIQAHRSRSAWSSAHSHLPVVRSGLRIPVPTGRDHHQRALLRPDRCPGVDRLPLLQLHDARDRRVRGLHRGDRHRPDAVDLGGLVASCSWCRPSRSWSGTSGEPSVRPDGRHSADQPATPEDAEVTPRGR